MSVISATLTCFVLDASTCCAASFAEQQLTIYKPRCNRFGSCVPLVPLTFHTILKKTINLFENQTVYEKCETRRMHTLFYLTFQAVCNLQFSAHAFVILAQQLPPSAYFSTLVQHNINQQRVSHVNLPLRIYH